MMLFLMQQSVPHLSFAVIRFTHWKETATEINALFRTIQKQKGDIEGCSVSHF